MTGLGVIYAGEATQEKEWTNIPVRDRTGRLREVYWAKRAEGVMLGKSFLRLDLHLTTDRGDIGRQRDNPGDRFVFLATVSPKVDGNFEWIEVTEVFTTTSAEKIDGAMRVWNGISGNWNIDFDRFRQGLKRGRPARAAQRRAADDVIDAVRKKARKRSYDELVEKYGYGTLVVGMPFWFAVPPINPFRPENALDDFFVRTILGLEEIKRTELRRHSCPFKHVIVIWDPTPEAIQEWNERRSREYEDVTNVSLITPITLLKMGQLLEIANATLEKEAIPESERPSMMFHIDMKVKKSKSGKGPYPEVVKAMQEILRRRDKNEKQEGTGEKLKRWIALQLCKLLCFVRLNGIDGLEKWVTRRFSLERNLRRIAAERRAGRLYRESIRRQSVK